MKAQRDIYTAVAEARDEGRQEGQQEGALARIHSLQRLLRQVPTPAEQLSKLSLEELRGLADQLEADAASKLAGQS